jgi:hypothetical protein
VRISGSGAAVSVAGIRVVSLAMVILPFRQSFVPMIVLGVPSPLHYRHII